MKKILYIKPNIKFKTGGTKVNNQIYKMIKEIKDIEIVVKNDDYFWPNNSNIKSSFSSFVQSFIFNFKYLSNISEIKQFDYILVDSRLFPRLFIFIKFIKINTDLKVISTHHHFYHLQQDSKIKESIYRLVEMDYLKNVDKILTFSQYTYDIAIEKGIKKDKLSLNELGFNKKNINDINKTNKNFKKEILFIGSIEPRKGLEYLIRAIANLSSKKTHKNIKVNIVGEYNSNSDYYNKLLELVDEFNLDKVVIFHGRLSNEKVNILKRKSLFFVFPSLYEGFGMVMAESMLYGLPVIAFNNSAIPYLVEDNYNGLLVKNKDIDDLSKKIKLLLNNSNLRGELSKGALETANSLNSNNDFLLGVKKTLQDFIQYK
jgi:glycosyltransferase involved in cell wall biosynthesis